jgi:hypothetical protein
LVSRHSQPSIVFYISGHGFGHASRQIEIINALGTLRPDLTLVVRTSVPQWLFDRRIIVPVTLLPGECDAGVVQIDSLRLNEQATIETAAAFYQTLTLRAKQEADVLRNHGARLVLSDAPPLASAAAALAGLPSIVISNFTWDWIYEGYGDHLASAPALLPSIRAAYRQATEGWRLPMHGGFATFGKLVNLPFVAPRAQYGRDRVRQVLKLPPERTLVLASFGGIGVKALEDVSLDCLDQYDAVFTVRDTSVARRPGVFVLAESEIYRQGLRYTDLVSAMDAIVTKPGYGIVSECITGGCAMVYTSRGHFREYDVLVAEMPRHIRCTYIDHEALFSGRWGDALDRVMSQPAPSVLTPTNGAQVAAAMISERL